MKKQMPFVAGEGDCPSALSRALVRGVHRSAAETLDRRSGGIRRRVWPGRADEGKNYWRQNLQLGFMAWVILA